MAFIRNRDDISIDNPPPHALSEIIAFLKKIACCYERS